jgi:hypothetical protein
VRRTNLVVVFGRGSVKLEGKIRGTWADGDEIAAAASLFLSNNSTKGHYEPNLERRGNLRFRMTY